MQDRVDRAQDSLRTSRALAELKTQARLPAAPPTGARLLVPVKLTVDAFLLHSQQS